jgi:hypothetical protein
MHKVIKKLGTEVACVVTDNAANRKLARELIVKMDGCEKLVVMRWVPFSLKALVSSKHLHSCEDSSLLLQVLEEWCRIGAQRLSEA